MTIGQLSLEIGPLVLWLLVIRHWTLDIGIGIGENQVWVLGVGAW